MLLELSNTKWFCVLMILPIVLIVSSHEEEGAEPHNKLISSEWVLGLDTRKIGDQCYSCCGVGIRCINDCREGLLA